MSSEKVMTLPPMTDLHQLFNPQIAPPLANTQSVIQPTATATSQSAAGSVRGVSRILKNMSLQRKNSKGINISNPTNFRHLVHIGSNKIEVYNESGSSVGLPEQRTEVFEFKLDRRQGGFGMNIKTIDGRTTVTVVVEGGSAQRAGVCVDDELLQIGEHTISGLSHEEVIALIREKQEAVFKVARSVQVESGSVGSSSNGSEQFEPLGCRVCGKPASFNCSACGPHITYCGVECQRSDWTEHKKDCQLLKKKDKESGSTQVSVPLTGACRVCRAKNARYRCICGGAMYCSQKCQAADWPNHALTCSAKEAQGAQRKPPSESRQTFFATVDRYLSKMMFKNGVFDCKWTVELQVPSTNKKLSDPSLHPCQDIIYVTYQSYVCAIKIEKGETIWTCSLGYPFNEDPLSLVDWKNLVVIGGAGHLVFLDKNTGAEVSRKILDKAFPKVTLYRKGSLLFALCGANVFCVAIEGSAISLVWRKPIHQTPTKIPSFPSYDESNQSLYVTGPHIVKCNPLDGSIVKTSSQKNGNTVPFTSFHDGKLIVLHNGVVTRYKLDDMSVMWSTEIAECQGKEGTLLQNKTSITVNGVASPDILNIIYVGINCRVVALDASNGETKWTAKLMRPEENPSGFVTMILLGDDLVSATGGKVYALSANSGNPLRKAQLPHKVPAPGLIALTSMEDMIYTSYPANVSSLFERRITPH